MRKTLKNKKRCCGLCKYFKRGRGNHWKNKQFFLLRLAEKEIRNYTK